MPISSAPTRIGVVSFLNTLPLIDGLGRVAGLELRPTVPSRLVDALAAGEVDLALCSSIDYQRCPVRLLVAPVGVLGCAGPTLTVRLFSRVPVEDIEEIHCDTDSHTSVALLRILLAEVYGLRPRLVGFDAAGREPGDPWPPAVLLIGDKVVIDAPPREGRAVMLDLGDLWHRHTGAPFAFATWMARRDGDLAAARRAARILDRQLRHNRERIDGIVHREAAGRGWPEDAARTYLTRRLLFDYTPQVEAGMVLFFEKAAALGLIDEVRPVETLDLR